MMQTSVYNLKKQPRLIYSILLQDNSKEAVLFKGQEQLMNRTFGDS